MLVTASIWGSSAFLFPGAVRAETPLNRAIVQSLRNTVRLLLQNQRPRPAKVRDAMVPGDALSTARSSLAELRFNDGSLARVGEQALFQFISNTRTFRLNNGTVLLLIPPGRGRTRVQTPNAVAGIRGSALFVRYLPDFQTTIVGALTQSGIEVSNSKQTQTLPLNAGQMAVIVKDRIERLYNFDLRTFYETSEITKGLNLSGKESVAPSDADIQTVQAETIEATNNQTPIAGSETIQNPAFLRPSANSSQATDTTRRSRNPIERLEESRILAPVDLKILNPSSVTQPRSIPPTVSIPLSPGQSGASSGLSNPNPGSVGNNLPGLPVIPPGLTGSTPGLGNSNSGGLSDVIPDVIQGVGNVVVPARGSNPAGPSAGITPNVGNASNPGSGVSGPPGQTGTAPGLAGTSPGRGGLGPPGQTGTAPGRAGTTPGQAGR